MKKLLFTLVIMISFNCKAQEPVFSQYYFNPIYLNPALRLCYSGGEGSASKILNIRRDKLIAYQYRPD